MLRPGRAGAEVFFDQGDGIIPAETTRTDRLMPICGDSGDECRCGSGGLAGSAARASDRCSLSGVGEVTVFFSRRQLVPYARCIRKIDRLMPIVAGTGRFENRGNSRLKSRAQIFDGSWRRFFLVRRKNFALGIQRVRITQNNRVGNIATLQRPRPPIALSVGAPRLGSTLSLVADARFDQFQRHEIGAAAKRSPNGTTWLPS